jgi:hypothetical protein
MSERYVFYLIILEVKFPGHVLLLRGNHESRQCTQVYGFYEEIQKKYGNMSPWRMFMDLFDCLPLAAIIEGKIENCRNVQVASCACMAVFHLTSEQLTRSGILTGRWRFPMRARFAI